MYSSIIEIKKVFRENPLTKLRQTAEKAFSNRAGSVKNSSLDSHRLIFKGGEQDYGCLDLGVAKLARVSGFLLEVDSWNWVDDEEPDESCNVLEVYSRPLR